MDKQQMLITVKNQLAIDLNCDPADFTRDEAVFCTWQANPGRRNFAVQQQHFEMLTMGGRGIIVSATSELLAQVREPLQGLFRDDAFAQPFVYGHSLYFLPDMDEQQSLPCPPGCAVHLLEGKQIHSLYATVGFENALHYDPAHACPNVLAAVAEIDGALAGVAGASADCARMWQVGVDVRPPYQQQGIAAFLVSYLTREVLHRGIVPYYGTASSNLDSQKVAYKAAYKPSWMCAYRGRFADQLTNPTG